MPPRTQITLESETQRRARQRASELGISLAEYVRILVKRDLEAPKLLADISCIFNLGSSGDSDISKNKDAMIGEAFAAEHRRTVGSAVRGS
jgi:hypothetical protein